MNYIDMQIEKKYIRIYYTFVYYDEDELCDLELTYADALGHSSINKIGYDHMECVNFVINEEREILKEIQKLRVKGLYNYWLKFNDIDNKTLSSRLTYDYLDKFFNGYAEEKYPELLV